MYLLVLMELKIVKTSFCLQFPIYSKSRENFKHLNNFMKMLTSSQGREWTLIFKGFCFIFWKK